MWRASYSLPITGTTSMVALSFFIFSSISYPEILSRSSVSRVCYAGCHQILTPLSSLKNYFEALTLCLNKTPSLLENFNFWIYLDFLLSPVYLLINLAPLALQLIQPCLQFLNLLRVIVLQLLFNLFLNFVSPFKLIRINQGETYSLPIIFKILLGLHQVTQEHRAKKFLCVLFQVGILG